MKTTNKRDKEEKLQEKLRMKQIKKLLDEKQMVICKIEDIAKKRNKKYVKAQVLSKDSKIERAYFSHKMKKFYNSKSSYFGCGWSSNKKEWTPFIHAPFFENQHNAIYKNRNKKLYEEIYDTLLHGRIHPDIKVVELKDRSSLRILQHGLSIEELADNELPGKPKYIWTIKKDNLSEYDGYIVVSFEGNTLILEIGESVEEVSDTLLLNNVTTLHINILYDNSFIQVYDTGIRHINGKVVQEWVAPKNKQIKAASSNSSQIVISLSGGELIYFEIDESHTLVEIFRKNLNVEVLCLSIQQIPPNRVRANFLAVGCLDNVVRLLSIEKDKYFKQLSTHLLPNNSSPQDICISEMNDNGNTMKERNIIFLNIGLNTGVLLRSIIDRS